MENRIASGTLLSFALCLTACGARQEDFRKYVGDGKLTPASMSARESVSIMLAKPTSDGTANLDMLLTPDGKLSLKRYAMHWPPGGPLDGQETGGPTDRIDLTPEQAAAFRKRLAQVRPTRLGPYGPMLTPRGCDWTYDDRDRVNVVFADERKNWGNFVIQFTCANLSASKVAEGLRQAIEALPGNQVSTGFQW